MNEYDNIKKVLDGYNSLSESVKIDKASFLNHETIRQLSNQNYKNQINMLKTTINTLSLSNNLFPEQIYKNYLLSHSQEIQKSLDSLFKTTANLVDSSHPALSKNFSNVNEIYEDKVKSLKNILNIYDSFVDNNISIKNVQKSIDNILKSFELEQFTSTLKLFENNDIWNNILKQSDIQNKLSEMIINSKKDILSEMMDIVKKQPISVINEDYILSEEELEQATEILSTESEYKSFIKKFNKLPFYLQTFLIFIIMHFLIPIANNIIVNMLTPDIDIEEISESLFSNEPEKKLSKISNLKIDISNLRYIIARNGLHVRTNPSIRKSQIKDTIYLGQIVKVIEKRKNWIKISYRKKDKTINGWVFTRYTKKFDL